VTNRNPVQRGHLVRIRYHNVVPGATMNVNVNKAWRKDCVLQIHDAAICRDLAVRARAEPADDAILDQQQGLVDPLHRCQQRCRSQRNHEKFRSAADGKVILYKILDQTVEASWTESSWVVHVYS